MAGAKVYLKVHGTQQLHITGLIAPSISGVTCISPVRRGRTGAAAGGVGLLIFDALGAYELLSLGVV